MLATSRSVALIGVDAVPVEVEVDVSPGIPSFTLVGLPDQAVSEARERVRAAIRNSGYPFPAARITVNLAPADLRKEVVGVCGVHLYGPPTPLCATPLFTGHWT